MFFIRYRAVLGVLNFVIFVEKGFVTAVFAEIAEFCELRVIGESKPEKRKGCDDRSDDYVRRSSAEAGFCFIGQTAEKRQKKYRDDVVERHYHARNRLT